MNDEISRLFDKLASKSVLERKVAIKALKRYADHKDGHMVRLSLHYVSEHDPCYTVRNVARAVCYSIRAPPPDHAAWEHTYAFNI